MTLTSLERKALADISLFDALVYRKFYHETCLAERVPYNDLRLLRLLNTNTCNNVVRDAEMATFKRHLWYFSEHLVGLAFYDPCINVHTKAAMVKNLKRAEKKSALSRIESKNLTWKAHWNYTLQAEHLIFSIFSLITGQSRLKISSQCYPTFGKWI